MPTDPVLLHALTHHTDLTHGEVHNLLARWRDTSVGETNGLTEKQTRAIETAAKAQDDARRVLARCRNAGISAIASDDTCYPDALTRILGRARPPLLFCAGDPRLLPAPAVSIIGSRNPPDHALEFTREAARILAARDTTIVSGYAHGIDRAASHAALDAGGSTIVFLAQGLLTFEREGLARWIDAGRALAVSAFSPHTGWQTPLAMARNAMITAATLHTIVGHAGPRGGSWEASRGALRQGRRVWVRDDPSPDLGHHALAGFGAHLVPHPSARFESQIAALARDAHEGDHANARKAPWTDEAAARLLAKGSPADIHDATGLTGQTLLRIVEARGTIRIRRLGDLEKIDGIGPGTTRQIAEAFGLPADRHRGAQLALFAEDAESPQT